MARHKIVNMRGTKNNGKKKAASDELPSDDEIDKFHRQKETLRLSVSDDEDSEEEEEGLYNLNESEEESEEEEDDEDEEDDADDDGSGRLAERASILIEHWLQEKPHY